MTLTLFGLLCQAALYTVAISAGSIVFGLIIGLGVCAARLSQNRWLSVPAMAFISFFRGVPLLVQLLLIYNLLPGIGINVPSLVAAVTGLSLCTAAYQAENLRGGFAGVSRGLLEAADMVGLTPFQQFLRIRAPIAFRLTLPALVNEAILILQSSSLVSVVGVVELTRASQDMATTTYKPLHFYAAAGLLYFAINRLVAYVGGAAERYLSGGRA